jgi:hypothetical protein
VPSRYTLKPQVDERTMRHLGSTLRPEYDPLVHGPLPRDQRHLVLQYAVAEAVSSPERKRPCLEVVPHLPS